MKCKQTIIGALAIVGLGYLAGATHAIFDPKPVALRLSPAMLNQGDPAETPVSNTAPVEPDAGPETQTDPIDPVDPSALDPLDIPGPEGTITLREAKALHDEGAYFVDARLEHEFNESHIPYAMFLPAQRIRTRDGLDELSTIPPDITIVVYCVGGECDASHNTMMAMLNSGLGFTDIRIMGRGFIDWVEAGLPVEHEDGSITKSNPEGTP
tara:strand:+ start:24984 stop:25616 length:633 start_codon:yes stop_codon:yes gene_type:complete